MSGTPKERNRSTTDSANGSAASNLSARESSSDALGSCVNPPTTAVIGWMERPPTRLHSSLPSAFNPNAWSNNSGLAPSKGKTLGIPKKSGAANTNRCDAWFCR